MNEVPSVVRLFILEYVAVQDLCRFAQCSRRSYKEAASDVLWGKKMKIRKEGEDGVSSWNNREERNVSMLCSVGSDQSIRTKDLYKFYVECDVRNLQIQSDTLRGRRIKRLLRETFFFTVAPALGSVFVAAGHFVQWGVDIIFVRSARDFVMRVVISLLLSSSLRVADLAYTRLALLFLRSAAARTGRKDGRNSLLHWAEKRRVTMTLLGGAVASWLFFVAASIRFLFAWLSICLRTRLRTRQRRRKLLRSYLLCS